MSEEHQENIESQSGGYYGFTQGLIKLLEKLKETHETKKAAWFQLNQYYLAFSGRCPSAEVREEAFKLVKFLAEKIPLDGEKVSTELEGPLDTSGYDIDQMIAAVQHSRKILPEDIKTAK